MYRRGCKWVLTYLHGSIDRGLHNQSASGFSLTSFSDANWASCVDERRSTNGFYVFLGPNIVSWSSRKQKVVRRSNTESWYKALAHTAAEVTWLQALLKELQVPSSSRPLIWCDNIRVACITAKLVAHARTKQMEVDVHFVRDKVLQKELDIRYVPSYKRSGSWYTNNGLVYIPVQHP